MSGTGNGTSNASTRAIRRSPHQVSCDLGDQTVIFNLKTSIYYCLNPVAARIWELIQEPSTVERIQCVLLEEYRVEPEQCRTDVEALISVLREKGMIEVESTAPR